MLPGRAHPTHRSTEPATVDARLVDLECPLQNLRDGDGRWRIRLSIDGDSFLTDQQEAIWLKGTGSKATTVQVELLNGQGEPLQPVFNNRLVRLKDGSRDRPVWLKARLSEDELERLSGTPRQKLIDPNPHWTSVPN